MTPSTFKKLLFLVLTLLLTFILVKSSRAEQTRIENFRFDMHFMPRISDEILDRLLNDELRAYIEKHPDSKEKFREIFRMFGVENGYQLIDANEEKDYPSLLIYDDLVVKNSIQELYESRGELYYPEVKDSSQITDAHIEAIAKSYLNKLSKEDRDSYTEEDMQELREDIIKNFFGVDEAKLTDIFFELYGEDLEAGASDLYSPPIKGFILDEKIGVPVEYNLYRGSVDLNYLEKSDIDFKIDDVTHEINLNLFRLAEVPIEEETAKDFFERKREAVTIRFRYKNWGSFIFKPQK